MTENVQSVGNNIAENISKAVRIQEINNIVNGQQINVSEPTTLPIKSILKTSSIPNNQIPEPIPQQTPQQNIVQFVEQQIPVQSNMNHELSTIDYYTFFGFQLSKTTIYILIGFILSLVIYYIYVNYYSVSTIDKKKKKRVKDVTYQQQQNIKNKEELRKSLQNQPEN
jgi:hypothetical protein